MKNDKRENVNSTSMVEGYNNVSKLIKRISFGIKDINIYTLKVCSHA
ncbi:MAG: hypothetical protein H5U37_05580 [Caldisericia bacterium]|nr:hypothetical protein [Caldisericia bacterium]